MLILHISCTPLAGAPIRLINAINKYSDNEARLVNLNSNAYGNRVFEEDLSWNDDKEEVIELIKNADIIHMHHYFDYKSEANPFEINFEKTAKKNCKFIRQYHSHPKVIFNDNYDRYEELYDEIPSLVIPHNASRYYPKSVIVPNIVPINDILYKPKKAKNKKIIIAFSPSSKKSAFEDEPSRWDTKSYPEVISIIKNLQKKYDFEFILIENKSHEECLKLKQSANILIDDVTTGSMHLSALEGLSQGSVVLSYLDNTVYNNFLKLSKSSELPVVNVFLYELKDVLENLLNNREVITDLSKYSRNWMEKHYSDKEMVQYFIDAYDKLINNEELFSDTDFIAAKSFLRSKLPDLIWENRKKKNMLWLKFQLKDFLIKKDVKAVLKTNCPSLFEVLRGFKHRVRRKLALLYREVVLKGYKLYGDKIFVKHDFNLYSLIRLNLSLLLITNFSRDEIIKNYEKLLDSCDWKNKKFVLNYLRFLINKTIIDKSFIEKLNDVENKAKDIDKAEEFILIKAIYYKIIKNNSEAKKYIIELLKKNPKLNLDNYYILYDLFDEEVLSIMKDVNKLKENISFSKQLEKNKQKFLKYLNNKSISVVGSSPCEIGKKNGELIDSADVVGRFNNYKLDDGLTIDYGSKTNIWIRTQAIDVLDRENNFDFVLFSDIDNIIVSDYAFSILNRYRKNAVLIEKDISLLVSDLSNSLCVSSGLVSSKFFKDNCKKSYFYGFSFVDQVKDSNKTHYYRQSINYKTRIQGVLHQWEKEKIFFDGYIK